MSLAGRIATIAVMAWTLGGISDAWSASPTKPRVTGGSSPAIDIDSVSAGAAWVRCASQDQKCGFPAQSGARLVRFGANGKFIVRAFLLSPTCNATSFGGDPAPGVTKSCQYSGLMRRTLPAPTSTMAGPAIDRSRIPIGHIGDDKVSIRPSAQQANPDSVIGAFRTHCFFSHMNFDDPIVYPDQQGASHLHTYFGNTLADYSSKPWTISQRGRSTCSGGIANRTAYWTPSVIDTRNRTPVAPREMGVYYKTGYG
jgi:hypothetical protein